MSTCDRLYKWKTVLFKASPENGYTGIAPSSDHCLSAVSKILEAPKSRGHLVDPHFTDEEQTLERGSDFLKVACSSEVGLPTGSG